jgi:hypothetical protein
VWQFKAPRQPLGYYICSGIDLTEAFKTPLKIYGVVELSSLVVNIYVYIRIRKFKNTSMAPVNQVLTNRNRKGIFLNEVETLSMASLITDFCNILYCVFLLLNQALVNMVDPQNINRFPYTVYIYYIFIVSPALLTDLSIFLYYYKQKNMRRVLLKETKELLLKLKDNFNTNF